LKCLENVLLLLFFLISYRASSSDKSSLHLSFRISSQGESVLLTSFLNPFSFTTCSYFYFVILNVTPLLLLLPLPHVVP